MTDWEATAPGYLGWMQREASRGRMNRREFIQFALAAGLTVSAAEAMFSQARAAAPKEGGDYVSLLAGAPQPILWIPLFLSITTCLRSA